MPKKIPSAKQEGFFYNRKRHIFVFYWPGMSTIISIAGVAHLYGKSLSAASAMH
jgi:hypothetical protein